MAEGIIFNASLWSSNGLATYWIRGLSTMGNGSLGIAFAAGINRVPKPVTEKTALRSLVIETTQNLMDWLKVGYTQNSWNSPKVFWETVLSRHILFCFSFSSDAEEDPSIHVKFLLFSLLRLLTRKWWDVGLRAPSTNQVSEYAKPAQLHRH